jgi:hypothetical protein
MTELEVEIIGYFQLMYDWLLQQDKRLVIYSWNGAKVLKCGVEIPNNRHALKAYTSNHWKIYWLWLGYSQ